MSATTLRIVVYDPLPAGPADIVAATLSTDHVASSYGRPVLVIDGTAYGPGDVLPSGQLAAEADVARQASVDDAEDDALLCTWASMCAAFRARVGAGR